MGLEGAGECADAGCDAEGAALGDHSDDWGHGELRRVCVFWCWKVENWF